MPLPVITDAYRVIVGFTGASSSKPWSTHWDYLDTSGLGNAADLATIFDTALNAFKTVGGTTSTEVQDYFTTDTDLVDITVYALDGISAPVVITPASVSFGTGSNANTLPPDLAVVSTLRTTERGARGRGRQYWQANNDLAKTSAGLVATGLRDNLSTGIFATFQTLTGVLGTYDWSVIGRAAEGNPTLVIREITSVSCDAHFDVQRRRGQG